MENLVLIIIAILLCCGATYKWVKYVEAVGEASITLKGDKLKKVLPKQTTKDG